MTEPIPFRRTPTFRQVSGRELDQAVKAAPSEERIYELMAKRQSNDLAGALRGEWPSDGGEAA